MEKDALFYIFYIGAQDLWYSFTVHFVVVRYTFSYWNNVTITGYIDEYLLMVRQIYSLYIYACELSLCV